jgi:hypothetical protein
MSKDNKYGDYLKEPTERDKAIVKFLENNLPDGQLFVLITVPPTINGEAFKGKNLKVFSNSDGMPSIVRAAAYVIPGVLKDDSDDEERNGEDSGEEWKRKK